jgi:hypothetical protein
MHFSLSIGHTRSVALRFAMFIATALAIGAANAAPRLVTPQVPPAVQGQSYTSRILVGSDLALKSASVTGLPAGLGAAHDGVGGLLISGTPSVAGNFVLTVNAADNAAATLSGSVNLLVRAGVNTASKVSVDANHTCAIVASRRGCV